MALSPTAYRFTVKDYHRMAEADIFEPDDRVELIDGEVVKMSPIGTRHAACVSRLMHLVLPHLGERAIGSVKHPIQLGEFSEPQPDIALLRWRDDFYADHHPLPADVHLVVEVDDTSLRYDLVRKAPLYIAGGVRRSGWSISSPRWSTSHAAARRRSWGPGSRWPRGRSLIWSSKSQPSFPDALRSKEPLMLVL